MGEGPEAEYEVLFLQFVCGIIVTLEAAQDGHVTKDGDREGQEREGGVRRGLGEFQVGVKGVSKVNELFKLLMGAEADTVIKVEEEE
eukprot:g27761.t1